MFLFDHTLFKYSFFKTHFIHSSLERGDEREKERERKISQPPLTHALMGAGTHSPGMGPDREATGQPFALRYDGCPAESHQSGLAARK